MDKFQAGLQQFSQFWQSLSLGRQIAIALSMLTVLGAGLYVSFIGPREDYAVLYGDLATEDAAAIVQKLRERKVLHRVVGAGGTVEVPESQVHSLRLELASEGLPRGGGKGFELFDKPRIGATEFEQQVNLRRALEGELARSINTIDGVSAARVHLVLPERRLFLNSDQQASASVVLKLNRPMGFSKQDVAATVHLVATAVPGLSRDRISVVSTDGATLHRPSGSSDGGAGTDDLRLEQEREVAGRLEEHVKSLLERVVGTGNAEVRMSVQLNPAVTERTLERYEPAKTALRSEYETLEHTGSEGASVAGVPGAASNLGNRAGEVSTSVDALGNIVRRSHQRNWEIDRVLEKTKIPAGQIERLSMAVLINKNTPKPLGKPQLESLGQMAQGAVGFTQERGDTFSLQAQDFAKVEVEPLPEEVTPIWKKAINWGAIGIAGLAALLAVILILKSQKHRHKAERAYAELKAATVPGTLTTLQLPSGAPTGAQELTGVGLDTPRLRDGSPSAEQVRGRAMELASQDPATAAVILRSWLNSSGSSEAQAES